MPKPADPNLAMSWVALFALDHDKPPNMSVFMLSHKYIYMYVYVYVCIIKSFSCARAPTHTHRRIVRVSQKPAIIGRVTVAILFGVPSQSSALQVH